MSLDRFARAQETTYVEALDELRRGRKTSHWIWFILPQLRGLGHSGLAQHFGLDGIEEARRYLDDPLLRGRLCEVVAVVHEQVCLHCVRIKALMGSSTDALKLVSCLTLFGRLARDAASEHPSEGLAALAAQSAEILDAARAQGYPPCPLTSARFLSDEGGGSRRGI
jgi:uncharacterized protein (DUF1810 family)